GEERVCLFNMSNPVKAISNLYYRSITASDPIVEFVFCKYFDSLEIEGIYINNPLNTTYNKFAREDTLLLSTIPQEDLVWSSYSLDDQSLVNFSHSVYIPMPEEGRHKIQVFGENSLSEYFESDIRYFSIKSMLIEIKSPLSEFYPEPDFGYIYNASYGFDYDINGSQPSGLDSSENVYVTNYVDNHIKVVEIDYQDEYITTANEFPRAYGTIEFWIRFGDIDQNIYLIEFRDSLTDDYLIFISASNNEWHYSPDYQTQLQIPNVANPQSNMWYHVRIDFRCNGAPTYLGLSEEYFMITIDGISSGALDFYYTGLNESGSFKIRTSQYNSEEEKLWVDAIGFSWDPNYTIGDNLGGIKRYAIPMIYESEVYFKNLNYSIDSNNTTPITVRDLALFSVNGTQTYELCGTDIFGDIYESNIVNLAIERVDFLTPSGTNVLVIDPFTGISFNFSNVITGGITSISLKTNESVPAFPSTIEINFYDYSIYILSTHFYEIATSAEIYDPFTITFPYPENRVQRNENNIRLYRYGGSWYDITQDKNLNRNEISGVISSFSYFVIIEILDDVRPHTEVYLNGSYAQQWNGYNEDIMVELIATDDFQVVDTLYTLNGINWTSYSGPFMLSRERYYNFQVYSIDDSNNSEWLNAFTILIDKSPPITEIIIDPFRTDSSGKIHYLDESTLSFVVNDTSNIYTTYFRIESEPYHEFSTYNEFTDYHTPIQVTDSDTWTIYFYSVDMFGHEEEIQSITISRY
ncbi:MAG: hypothetical protein V3W20_06850, partial [Candidatus Neomarinimicrobiota bacterium]